MRDHRLVTPPACARPRCADRPIADHAIRPTNYVCRQNLLAHEPQKRLLHDVLGRIAPLLGVQDQGAAVLVQEPRQQFRADCAHQAHLKPAAATKTPPTVYFPTKMATGPEEARPNRLTRQPALPILRGVPEPPIAAQGPAVGSRALHHSQRNAPCIAIEFSSAIPAKTRRWRGSLSTISSALGFTPSGMRTFAPATDSPTSSRRGLPTPTSSCRS